MSAARRRQRGDQSLEGKKGQPRLKPPFPAGVGLYGCPHRQQRQIDRRGAHHPAAERRVVRRTRLDVDVKATIEARLVHVQERLILVRVAGVVDDDVDGAEIVDGSLDRAIDIGTAGDVTFDADRRRTDSGRDGLRTCLVEVGNNDTGTFARVDTRNFTPKPLAAPVTMATLSFNRMVRVSVILFRV